MELVDFLAILWRRKWTVVVTVALAVAVAGVATTLMVPQYVATATVRIGTVRIDSGGNVQYNLDYSDRLMSTYARIATSRPLLDQLQRRLGLKSAPSASVALVANTELMQISVSDRQATLAARAATTLTDLLIARFEQDEQGAASAGGGSSAMSVIEPADVPQSPSTPNKKINLGLGLLLGLVAGMGLATLFENVRAGRGAEVPASDIMELSGGPQDGRATASLKRDRPDYYG